MKKLIITLLLLCTPAFINIAEAHRGCCSWHGGVCGCQCCDGTGLSAKCAPYYPHCSDGAQSLDLYCYDKCMKKCLPNSQMGGRDCYVNCKKDCTY